MSAPIKSLLTSAQLSVAGNITMQTSKGDISINGSNVVADGDVVIDAARNLTIQSANSSGSNYNMNDDQAIGKVTISDTEHFSGYHTEKSNDNSKGTTSIGSGIGSNYGNVTLSAGGTYTQNASNVVAAKNVKITAASVAGDIADESGSSASNSSNFKFGTFARVGSPILDLINNVEAAQKSDGRKQGSGDTYNSLTPQQKESVLLNNADATTIAAYNEAQTTLSHWGVGGDYSRALSVVTNIVVGSTAGATTTQLTANAVAPYAAELIGNTFDHTDNPNQVAQLLSHGLGVR